MHAVDGVSFTLEARQTLGLVGESGCGKSTTGRTVLLLERPTSGHIHFQGQDLARDAAAPIDRIAAEHADRFPGPDRGAQPPPHRGPAHRRAVASPRPGPEKRAAPAGGESYWSWWGCPCDAVSRFPHEFSGGQCQRIAIARSLAVEPSLLVLDEPVSALDVSIQAQILQLLTDLQSQFGLSYLFIAHDLAVVGEMSDRVAVMYLGKIVELADRDSLYARPHHPYTQALFSAVPIPDPTLSKLHHRAVVTGEVPSSLSPPAGCRFHTRCPMAQEVCRVEEPKLENVGDGHQVACHFAKEAVETNPFGSAVSSFVVEQLMTLRHPEPVNQYGQYTGARTCEVQSAPTTSLRPRPQHLLKRTEAQTDGVN